MIYFDKVTKVYTDESIALQDITLSIEPKEFVSVVGHSGAGKTTLLKLILGEEKPSAGSVYFESVNIYRLPKTHRNHLPRFSSFTYTNCF